MKGHPERSAILQYVEGDYDETTAAVASHVIGCDYCQATAEGLRELIALLQDGEILRYVDDSDANSDRETTRSDILTAECLDSEAQSSADDFFQKLMDTPIETWEQALKESPDACTGALSRRLIAAAITDLDREPTRALALLRIAELIAYALEDVLCRRSLGHIAKQRSNAYRMMGRYDEAVDEALLAEHFYISLPQSDALFEVGQARHALAAALVKVSRYDAALEALAQSRAALDPYGKSAPLAKTMMLQAVLRIEQGDISTARESLLELLGIEEVLNQPLELARVHANLAECYLRLGDDMTRAMRHSEQAIELFRSMQCISEVTRSEWTAAMIRVAKGDDTALEQLEEIAATFDLLGMPADAGFVKLDIAQERLRRNEWDIAAIILRQLVPLFRRAGATYASVDALDYLRRAVEQREATVATLAYVRSFVAIDDPNRPFAPPPDTVH